MTKIVDLPEDIKVQIKTRALAEKKLALSFNSWFIMNMMIRLYYRKELYGSVGFTNATEIATPYTTYAEAAAALAALIKTHPDFTEFMIVVHDPRLDAPVQGS